MARFMVMVGGIGTVYEGNYETRALQAFDTYKAMSLAGVGRAAEEAVILFEDGEIREELPCRPD